MPSTWLLHIAGINWNCIVISMANIPSIILPNVYLPEYDELSIFNHASFLWGAMETMLELTALRRCGTTDWPVNSRVYCNTMHLSYLNWHFWLLSQHFSNKIVYWTFFKYKYFNRIFFLHGRGRYLTSFLQIYGVSCTIFLFHTIFYLSAYTVFVWYCGFALVRLMAQYLWLQHMYVMYAMLILKLWFTCSNILNMHP